MKCISVNSYCGEISSVNVIIRSSINLVFLSLFCNYEKLKKKSDFVISKFPVKVRNDRSIFGCFVTALSFYG